MAKRSLIYFTLDYPYGVRQDWKRQELEVLAEAFDEIYVAPLRAQSGADPADLPSPAQLLPPIMQQGSRTDASRHRIFAIQMHKAARFMRALQRVWQHRFALPDTYYQGWIQRAEQHIRTVEIILQSPVFQKHVEPLLPKSVCYFFWGAGYAFILPFLDPAIQKRSLVRFHNFDLYGERYNDHMPYQRAIIESAGCSGAVSLNGVERLRRIFPEAPDRSRYLPLGTMPGGKAHTSEDGALRLVSCAYARPVKRLHLIAEALTHLRFPVFWTHIGDGPELERTKAIISDKSNIKTDFVGRLPPHEVPRYYDGRSIDLFVNVSTFEGVPISIMEAMAAGIPTIATDVGGSGELVDDLVGKLLPKDLSSKTLAREIEAFAALSDDQHRSMRRTASARVAENFNIRQNTNRLADVLLALPH